MKTQNGVAGVTSFIWYNLIHYNFLQMDFIFPSNE